jgi:hypothetical protein
LGELSDERADCSVIAITDLRDVLAFPFFRESCLASAIAGIRRRENLLN